MAEDKVKSGYQFGTFKGVYTPSILTIVGVVMYLRFGWVLGNVGLPATLLIVTMSCAITFLTALSLSALATNMRVGGGGAYYIISRSLGLEAGAAIGVPLFLAKALSIAFYVIGFAEAFADVYPIASIRMIATITLVVLGLLTVTSADLALRMQLFILLLIIASLVSILAGGAPTASAPPEVAALITHKSFWPVFAVFFPAVTGIEAGLSMSGDLKSPAKSLPLGTLAAVVTGYLIYMIIPLYLSAVVADKSTLITDTFILRDVARWGNVVVMGVWAAALSSALGTLLGAPRTLQALARDGVLPAFVGRGYGKGGEPRVASLIAFLIAAAAIWLGDLNALGPVLTMFFLTSYGLLNLSAGLEQLIGAPSWHPKVRIPAAVSLCGAFACLAAMFMINAGATFVAAFVSATIFILMERRRLVVQWGDMRRGLLMLVARQSILRLSMRQPDERSWSPNILVLSGSPTTRWHLIELANAIASGEGCLTVATIIPTPLWTADKEKRLTESISSYLRKREIRALVKLLPADDVITGAESLVRAYGFGPIVPNTILLGETGSQAGFARFAQLIQLVYRTRRNLVLVREGEPPEVAAQAARHERIDIWWRGERENIGLMLALSLLLKRNVAWARATVTVKTVATSDAQASESSQRLEGLLKAQRDPATYEVIRAEAGDVFSAIRASSQEADMVLFGVRAPSDDVDTEHEYTDYYEHLIDSTNGLPLTAMVLAAEGIDYHRMLSTDN